MLPTTSLVVATTWVRFRALGGLNFKPRFRPRISNPPDLLLPPRSIKKTLLRFRFDFFWEIR